MADKRFSLTFDASMNIQQITRALQKVQSSFNSLDISTAGQKGFNKLFSSLDNAIKDFEIKAGKEITNMSDFKELERSLKKITSIYDRLRTEIKTTSNLSNAEILKMFPNTLDDSFQDATRALDQFKTKMKNVSEEIKKLETERDKFERKRDAASRKDATKGKKEISSGQMADLKAERVAIKKQREDAIKERERLEAELQKRIEEKSIRIKKDGTADKRYGDKGSNQQLLDDLKAARTLADNLEASFEKVEKSIKSSISSADVVKNIQQITQEVQEAQGEIDSLDQKIADLEADPELAKSFQNLIDIIQKLTGADLSGLTISADGVKQIQEALGDFKVQKIDEARDSMKKLEGAAENVGAAIEGATEEMDDFGNEVDETNRKSQDIERLADSIKDFFSISNAVQLFKNAVRDAIDTVKELDAAMTETAVVTDFDISDMWDQLPQYTSIANELGTTTLGAYETMTLFYQQGLKTNEVFEIGSETMKMARIAGMDYADATDKMTAALRGFNMELNAASAQKVNDVYSELAAITAADTNEIATAMTKTASIADNANMEFETTAAFLSQIIETTRESAETAGTAMKTVIARFQELKKAPSEIGEVDGEIVDANKIEGALRTIGVALRDTNGQFRDLDDVFLDIAKRWDGLDINTQRYIATIAAGSRQQSRFIAMMSNYDRTIQLVDAATNSAGSSQRQFEKTTESLESKLNRLANAWDSFTMGLANSEVIKFGVDTLTALITAINKITDILPGAGSGIAKLLIAIAGLRTGSVIFDGFFTNLKKTGTDAMGPIKALTFAFKDGFKIGLDDIKNLGVTIKGLGGTVKTLIPQLFGFNAATTATTASMGGAATATTGFSAALAACPIGWIIVGIAAVAAAVWGLVKAWQAASDAFKMQQINKSIDKMTDQIEGAKDSIESLEDSRSTLKNLQTDFSNLAKGTQEWKEKLVEVNQSVLDIIEKYPELSQYMTRTSSGTLGIKDEGWDALIANQESLIQNASYAKMGMQYARTDLQEKMDFEENITSALGKAFGKSIDTEAFGRNVGTAIGTTVATGFGLAGRIIGAEVGANLGAKYENEIQDAFAGISEWSNQAVLDTAGFLDTDWGKVVGIIATIGAGGIGGSLAGGIIGFPGDKNIEEKAQARITGGLSQNEFAQFLTELGNAQITFDEITGEFSDPTAAKKIFEDLGFEASFDDVVAQAKKLGGSFNDLIISAQKYSLAKEAEKDALIANAVTNSSIGGKNYADAVSNILGETQFANIEPMIEEKIDALPNNKKELKQLYAEKVGGHYENGELYSDSSMETEWKLGKDTMRQAIASAQLADDMGVAAVELSKVLNQLSTDQQALFSELFSSDGAMISDETYMEVMKKGAAAQGDAESASGDWIAQELGFANIEDMATSLGMNIEQVGEVLSTNLNAAKTRITNARKATVGAMKKYGNANDSYEKHAQNLAQLEEQFGPIFNQYLSSMFEAVSKAGDDALTSAAFNEYMKIANTGDENLLAEANSMIQSIDWSNPIQAVSSLTEHLSSGSREARQMAKNLLAAGAEAFSSGKQMQYFVKSSAFEGIKEEIDGLIESQGSLSAQNILDMADGCQDLKKMMKQTGISAAGMAMALTKFRKSEWTINQLTDAVLAAIGQFNSLDSTVAETLKTLSEFDPGVDENEVADFVSTYFDVLNENLEKGAVGNSQNFKILDFLFGEDWDDGLSGEALVAKMQQLRDFMGKNTEDMRASWADLAAGVTPEGGVVNKAALGSLNIQDKGTEISVTGFNGMTTEEVVGRIAEAYDVSKEYAQMMLTDLKNYSIDLAAELNENDLTAGLKKAYEELEAIMRVDSHNADMTSFEGALTKVIDMSEIEAIADAYGKSAEAIKEYFVANDVLVTDFYDENGFLLQSNQLLTELERVFSTDAGAKAGANWYAGFVQQTPDGKTVIDYEGMMHALGQLNLPDEAKASIANDIAGAVREGSASGETVYLDYEFSDGETRTIEIPANIDVQTAIANAERDLANAKIGEAVANAFGNIDVTFNIDNSGLGQITTQVTTAIQSADSVIKPTVDQGSLDTATSQVTAVGTNATPVATIQPNLDPTIRAVNAYKPPIKYLYIYEKIVPAEQHADGIKKSPDAHTALIGEEGPEIHQTADGAYLAAGPQLAHIEKGDTVYTAEETKKILNGKGLKMPRYSSGYDEDYGYKDKNNTSGTTEEEEVEIWENSFDKLYNLVRDIEEEMHRRERIEREYQKTLDSIGTTAGELYEITRKQLEQLQHEQQLNEQLRDQRIDQINQYQAENSEFTKYAKVVEDEFGEKVLRINWDQINQVQDTERGEEIEEYVSQLEEWVDELYDIEESLWDIEDEIEELKERGKEDYLELEERVKDALLDSYQKEIDELSDINEAIVDSNAKLIEAISSQISKLRQDRENEKEESDIAEKQRRLLYLSQDTSGANSLEILELQKEIDEDVQNHTDSLIDQKINELEEQNDQSALQRERQIELLQNQLTHLEESGAIWREVQSILDEGLDAEKGLIRGSKLEQILKTADVFAGMSTLQQMDWLEELENQSASAATYLTLTQGEKLDTIAQRIGEIQYFGATTAEPPPTKKDTGGGGGDSDSGGYGGGGGDGDGDGDGDAPASVAKETFTVYTLSAGGGKGSYVTKYADTLANIKKSFPKSGYWVLNSNGVEIYGRNTKYNEAQHKASKNKTDDILGIERETTETDPTKSYTKVVVTFGDGSQVTYSLSNTKWETYANNAAKSRKGIKSKQYKYKTGGLADFTGPAWLDGTKSKPEYVLNADQTRGFLTLVGILDSINTLGSTSTQNNGDCSYDIDINVESIGSDYDVEQLASKIKKMINSEARYRNNNAISLKR